MSEMATKDFSIKELACPCCGVYGMRDDFVAKLQELRDLINRPMIITSGYRCKRHNEAIKGEAGSQHLYGNAVDIHCVDSSERFDLISKALTLGFRGIGVDGAFVHIDRRLVEEFPVPMIWLYPEK